MSDSEGGWQEPHEYVSPWAPRDTGEADQAPGIGTPEASPRGNGDQDTVAFGVPDREAGADDQGSYVQRGRDDMWYGTGGDQAGDQGGYGQIGPRDIPDQERVARQQCSRATAIDENVRFSLCQSRKFG